jgi:orotidine-5'-phosphate decarboxylase
MNTENRIDRLIDRIDELKNPTVVGLDPTAALVPAPMVQKQAAIFGRSLRAMSEAYIEFGKTIIDAIADIVPAVKPQIAMYEALGAEGIAAYNNICEYAASRGLIVIGDVKRGDISSTAAAYATHLGGIEVLGQYQDPWCEDFVTVNPYLGSDGISPFTDVCKEIGKGIFVLVKTSNPSSAELQDIEVDGEPLYMRTAKLVEKWGAGLIGDRGYSSVGAVVGATHREVGAELRRKFPNMFFLVPGYGAQGATAEDIREFFDTDSRGCIVNSSRGIIGAWTKDERGADGASALTADEAIELLAETSRSAALRMKEELGGVLYV